MRVAEVESFEGVGGIETVLWDWKCVEKPKPLTQDRRVGRAGSSSRLASVPPP